MRDNLEELAGWVKKLNAHRNGSPLPNIEKIERRISQIIGGKAPKGGYINEYVCEKIFHLKGPAGDGYDGIFQKGEPHQGATVDFKYSGKHNCKLNVGKFYPDYYLAVRGPKAGTRAVYTIEFVFLLNGNDVKQLRPTQGFAPKVGDYLWWEEYKIYPVNPEQNTILMPTEEQKSLLALFSDNK